MSAQLTYISTLFSIHRRYGSQSMKNFMILERQKIIPRISGNVF